MIKHYQQSAFDADKRAIKEYEKYQQLLRDLGLKGKDK